MLKKIDLFSIQPKFYIFKKKNIQSQIGGFLTLIQISISTIFLLYTFKSFFNRENFTNSFTQDSMQYFQFNQSEIPFFISIYDYEANPVPIVDLDKYLGIEVEYLTLFNISKPQDKILRKHFKLEKCNLTSNLQNYASIVDGKIAIDYYLCLPQDESNLIILGSYGDFRGFSYIQIKILKCMNSTQNNNQCFDSNKIEKFIKNSILIYGMIDYNIDHNQPEDPFVSKIITEGYFMTSQYLKSIRVKRKKISYRTDYGFFFKSEKNIEKYLYDYSIPVIEDFNRDDANRNYFMDLYIEASGKNDVHNRVYQKLQDALAGSFTILASLHSLLLFIIDFFYDKIYFQKLINHIIDFEENDKIEPKLNKINTLRSSINNRNTFIDRSRSLQKEELQDNSGKKSVLSNIKFFYNLSFNTFLYIFIHNQFSF